MTLPFTISPMMHPTDQISTEESERHRHIYRHSGDIAEPRLAHSQHRVRAFSEAAETMLSSRRLPDCLANATPTPPAPSLQAFLSEPPQPCLSVYTAVASSSLSHRVQKEQQEVESVSEAELVYFRART